jgi:hypothetical protein
MPRDGATIFSDLIGKADLLSRGLRQAALSSLCVCTLLCASQISRAQTTAQTGNDEKARAAVRGSFVEPHPGLGRPNPLQLPKPLRDANGNLLHHSGRPVEISASPVSVMIFYAASINVMRVFIPWEFRVAGAFKR